MDGPNNAMNKALGINIHMHVYHLAIRTLPVQQVSQHFKETEYSTLIYPAFLPDDFFLFNFDSLTSY